MSRQLITCLPALGFEHFTQICSHRRRQAEPPMRSMQHPDCFELVYVSSGMQYRACNGFNYPLSGGQAIAIQAGQRHSTGIMPQGTGQVYWLHLAINSKKPLLGLSKAESQYIIHSLQQLEHPVLQLGKSCQHFFDTIIRHARLDASAQDILAIRHALLSIMQAVLHPEKSTKEQKDSALAILLQHPQLWPHPDMLAHQAGISLSRLRARCKEETGISLGDYLLHLRIQEAMKRLTHQPELSITDIALDLEFSSSQYFATVFKRYTALMPSQFRNELDSPEGKRRLLKLGLQ